jgi:hypothetical protein
VEACSILELPASQLWSSPWSASQLVAVSDIALGAVNFIIGWRLFVVAWGCLPTCLCGVVHDCLVVGDVLGGDAQRLPERAPKEVALSASQWALLAVSGQCNGLLSHPGSRKQNRSLHTCAQDVQITRTAQQYGQQIQYLIKLQTRIFTK